MTITEATTDRIVVSPAIPEASIPAETLDRVEEAMLLLGEIKERLDRVDELAEQMRTTFEGVVLELGPHHASDYELGWTDQIAQATHWEGLWNELTSLFDRYEGDPCLRLTFDEVARGEANVPVGTAVVMKARDESGTIVPMTVLVGPGPRAEMPGLYTLRAVDAPHQTFLANHEEVKVGVDRAEKVASAAT